MKKSDKDKLEELLQIERDRDEKKQGSAIVMAVFWIAVAIYFGFIA